MRAPRFEWLRSSKKPKELLNYEDTETLRHLEESTKVLVSKLREHIEGAEYQLVIGEDASGRLPALMLATVFKDVYEHRGLAAPMLRFIATSRPTNEIGEISDRRTSAVREALTAIKRTFDSHGRTGRVLLVTDTIDSGNSMEGLVNAVKDMGMELDVATVSFLKRDTNVDSRAEAFKKHWGVNVYWSQDNLHDVFRSRLSGVRKSKDGAYAIPNDLSIDAVRAARKQAILAAHRVAAEYIGGAKN